MKKFIPFSLFLFSFSLFGNPLPPELIKGDELYEKREEFSKAVEASEIFEKYLAKHPNSIEALWRASMANYYTGHLIDHEEQRIQLYEAGVKQGKRCNDLADEKRVECLFWWATNKILLKKEKGTLSLAFGITGIAKLFKKAAKIDPSYAASGPNRMLSLIYRKVPGFLGGDNQKAYNYINEAIKLAPTEPLNYKVLIKYYYEDGKNKEAKSLSQKLISTVSQKELKYFESKSAYKSVVTFLESGAFPEKK